MIIPDTGIVEMLLDQRSICIHHGDAAAYLAFHLFERTRYDQMALIKPIDLSYQAAPWLGGHFRDAEIDRIVEGGVQGTIGHEAH